MTTRTLTGEFTKGLWEQIPPFRLLLGLCPVLAVTTTLEDSWGMGLATLFVLVCSNLLISFIRNLVPTNVRIVTFIVIIASFVVVVEQLTRAYTPDLAEKLGIFIPLIVVNCVILGRAEAFASRNGPISSLADGLGIGIGFTMALSVIGAVRELLGTGRLTLFSQTRPGVFLQVIPDDWCTHTDSEGVFLFRFMVEPAGAFVVLGVLVMAMNAISKKQKTGRSRGGI